MVRPTRSAIIVASLLLLLPLILEVQRKRRRCLKKGAGSCVTDFAYLNDSIAMTQNLRNARPEENSDIDKRWKGVFAVATSIEE